MVQKARSHCQPGAQNVNFPTLALQQQSLQADMNSRLSERKPS